MNLHQRLYRLFASATILALLVAMVPAGSVAQATTPVINEFVFNHTGTDTHEYVEVFGPPNTDLSNLTVIEIEGDGSGAGLIDGVFPVGTTDASGFWTTGFLNNEIENGTVTILLVDGFAGSAGDDLDTDDDGVLDVTPWAELVDGVAVFDGGSGDQTYSAVVLDAAFDGDAFPPGGASRIPNGTDTDSASDWIRNDFDGEGLPGFTGTPEVGEALNTPSGENQAVSAPPPPSAPEVTISEIRIDQPGTDNDEYFELAGAPGTALDGLTYLVIGDGTGGSGVIEEVTDLSGSLLDASGFFVAAESSFSLGSANLTIDLNFENSDNVTHLLVWQFTGAIGDDLDTNDDGVFDVQPWGDLVDLIALVEEPNPPSSTEYHYGPPSIGPDGSFVPGHAFTCSSAWQIGAFDPTGGDDTPGADNACEPPALPPVINEFSASTTGADVEFVEVYGSDDTDYSAYTILEIEGDSTSATGTVDEVIPVGSTDPSGFWLGDLASNTLENGTITLLLVRDFSGAFGDDLDTDDDGSLDSMPWAELADAVAVHDGGPGDLTYGVPVLGPNYDGVRSFQPGGASRFPDGLDTDGASDWVRNDFDLAGIPGFTGTLSAGEALNTPGEPNQIFVPPAEACGDPFTPIYEIQGNGSSSPLDGLEVATEGVVVGDFQNNASADDGDLGGFHIQDPSGDGDAQTSDGIFVFASSPDVAVGDRVRVRGTVDEFFNLTEITSVALVLPCGSGDTIAPTSVSLPITDTSDFEPYEGMLVTFPQSLFISEYFNFDRFGEIVLTVDRQYQPTAVEEPGSPGAAAVAQANALGRITLDDGRSSQNPDPAIHPNGMEFTLSNRFRGGDTVQNVTGVMDFAFGLYRLQPTEGADYSPANPRPGDNPDLGGDLQVAAFNVLNYFTTLDLGPDICGPNADLECRGADDAGELARQRAKIVAALAELNADVVGLIEIQNDGDDASVADLVAGVNAILGPGTYDYIATGFIGTDAIKQAFIYKPASVTPVGGFAVLDSDEFVDPNNTGVDRSRPALAQTFMDNATGGEVTVVVNHLKSKGSGCGPGDDDPEQGSCNLTRTLGAQALVDWLATGPTGSEAGVLIIGDLNSYDKEDPIDVLRAAGYSDLLFDFQGELAYSFVFDGQLGYLDYAMASSDLVDFITGAAAWHINTDEPDILDYDTTFKQPAQDALFEPNEFRSSDHDPVIAGVCTDFTAPTLEVSVSPDTLWPANHEYVEVTASVVVSDNVDPDPVLTLLSVTSNEPDDAFGIGDGSTVNDVVIVDGTTFQLRAERAGTGDGRVYTITYQATDDCGNSTVVSAQVTVPLSQAGSGLGAEKLALRR